MGSKALLADAARSQNPEIGSPGAVEADRGNDRLPSPMSSTVGLDLVAELHRGVVRIRSSPQQDLAGPREHGSCAPIFVRKPLIDEVPTSLS
jgi:hypothetical protein